MTTQRSSGRQVRCGLPREAHPRGWTSIVQSSFSSDGLDGDFPKRAFDNIIAQRVVSGDLS
ncbi:hypothetical protein DPMN_150816 [Dreissena polymorpha]|uniref:Uncharacterized protein n=1 Tax=Dreissena polymorpha TaxID=45954 RepID=A0A9D4J5Y0_DREPO|nr:hypothetical protein DPMN_150816 [Dreissena polymorpha]